MKAQNYLCWLWIILISNHIKKKKLAEKFTETKFWYLFGKKKDATEGMKYVFILVYVFLLLLLVLR